MNIDELQERLDKELTNIYKNVLINGEWGIGKTYFINNYSKDKNSIYISLFGIDSLESFIFNIYLQIDSKIQGFFRKLNKKLKGVNIGFQYGSISIPYFEGDIINAIEKKTKDNKLLIIIDDLERKSSNINMEDILGTIENLNKIHNVSIIIIANENEIGRVEEKDKDVYNSFKEKIIEKTFNVTKYSISAREIIVNKFIDDLNIDIDKVMTKQYLNKFFSLHAVVNLRTINKSLSFLKLILTSIDYKELRIEELKEIIMASLAIAIENIDRLYIDKKEIRMDNDGDRSIDQIIIEKYYQEPRTMSNKYNIIWPLISIFQDRNCENNMKKINEYYKSKHNTNSINRDGINIFYQSEKELKETISNFYETSVLKANPYLNLDTWIKNLAEMYYYADLINIKDVFYDKDIDNAIDLYIDNLQNIEESIDTFRHRLFHIEDYSEKIVQINSKINHKLIKRYYEVLINNALEDKDNEKYDRNNIEKLFNYNCIMELKNINELCEMLEKEGFLIPNLNEELTEEKWSFAHAIWSQMRNYKKDRNSNFEKYIKDLLKESTTLGKYRIESLNKQYGIEIDNIQ